MNKLQVPELHIQDLSNCCRLKYDFINFTSFFNLFFGGFLLFWPNYAAAVSLLC